MGQEPLSGSDCTHAVGQPVKRAWRCLPALLDDFRAIGRFVVGADDDPTVSCIDNADRMVRAGNT